MDDKEAKKRAALAKHVKLAEYNLVHGMRSMRYWCVAEADQYETSLKGYHKTLTEMTGDKQTIMSAVAGVEEIAGAMMHKFVENFCGCNGFQTNPEFREEVDTNYMAYIQKVQKSVDAKQSHAPGFDTPRT